MKFLPPADRDRWRQLGLLTVTLVLLASVLWYQLRPAAPPPLASNPQVQAVPSPQALKLPESLRLPQLESVPERTEVGRNPFGFGSRPLPPPRPAPVAPPATYTPPAPPVPQGPPPIALKFIGYIVVPDGGRAMISLKDPSSGASFRAFEGDLVDGRYRVVKVSPQSVVLSYVDGSGQRTIPLGGG